MRKFIALAAICSVIMLAAWLTACKDKDKKSETTESTDKKDSAGAMVARGDYLANSVAGCLDCHSKRDFTKYSGPVTPGTEGGGGMLFGEKWGLPGSVYGKNITPDMETGIGSWTDDQILRAMTQGISKNGDTLFPIMPYANFNRMAKEDLLSIIAYIRTLKPIKNKVPDRQLMIPIAMAYPGNILQPSVDGNTRPAESDKVNYGKYLINMADCGTCHSPLTPHGPDMSREYAGGYTFDLGTNKVTTANITQDSTTGIGTWTEERFLNKFLPLREEKNYNYNPGNQQTIMPIAYYATMKDDDLKAIYAFLKTVAPIRNQVEKFPK